MAFLGLFGNYNKPGPGVNKDEPPKAAPIRFFQIFLRKFGKLVQANLIFMLPTAVVAALMVALYMFPTHIFLNVPSDGGSLTLDAWAMYVTPLPLILLFPFMAGLTFISRNFAREEHAFVWSDFWDAVKNNWKYFLLNGVILYAAYFILSFSMIYYYNGAYEQKLYYVPFWLCIVITLILLFAQYYLPVIFITFDLKFGHAFKNALIFTMAGLWRNLLLTIILGALVLLIIGVIPIMPLTVMLLIFLFVFIFFSFCSFLINFTIYPVIDRYMIKPYERQLEEAKQGSAPEGSDAGELYELEDEDEDDEEEDQYVYTNGKLVKKSDLKEKEKQEE